MNKLGSEAISIPAKISPVLADGVVSSAWVFVGENRRLMATCLLGATLAGTTDFKLEQAQDSVGTGVKDIPNKAATQLTAGDVNKGVLINCLDTELDANNDFTHCRITATTSAANLLGATLQGVDTAFEPASEYNTLDIVEIITYQ